ENDQTKHHHKSQFKFHHRHTSYPSHDKPLLNQRYNSAQLFNPSPNNRNRRSRHRTLKHNCGNPRIIDRPNDTKPLVALTTKPHPTTNPHRPHLRNHRRTFGLTLLAPLIKTLIIFCHRHTSSHPHGKPSGEPYTTTT